MQSAQNQPLDRSHMGLIDFNPGALSNEQSAESDGYWTICHAKHSSPSTGACKEDFLNSYSKHMEKKPKFLKWGLY